MWPVFPAGSLLGKIPSLCISARLPPRKKICSRILVRILPGSKILEKKFLHRNSRQEVAHSCGRNANPGEGAINLILRNYFKVDPGNKVPL